MKTEPIISALGRQSKEDLEFKASPGKVSKTLFQKQNTKKRAGAQVVEGREGGREGRKEEGRIASLFLLLFSFLRQDPAI
jgi:hypothetical protein